MTMHQYAVIDEPTTCGPRDLAPGFSRVSTHSSPDEALAAMELRDGWRYGFYQNYGARGRATVYVCLGHTKCDKYMRIVKVHDDLGLARYELEESGNHGSELAIVPAQGIAHCLKKEIDSILLGAGPKKCLQILRSRYSESSTQSRFLPDFVQLKNRKCELRKSMKGGWEMNNASVLLEWASTRMCEDPSDFFGAVGATDFSESVRGRMDSLLVLRVFSHDVDVDGQSMKSFGIVCTSRKVFSAVKRSVIDQEAHGVLGVSDGTYRLHFGGWTLVNFGTYRTHYVKGTYSKHYVPWSFMFVRTEHASAYRELFSTTVKFAREFFGVDISLRFGSLDHATCIANAFTDVWPEIKLITCWAHVARKTREKATLLQTDNYYEDVVLHHVQLLYASRTYAQFRALAEEVVNFWRESGENRYADWFTEVYLTEPWDSWFSGVAGDVRGVLPSQNALESFHGVIKTVCIADKGLPTAAVLNSSLPGILAVAGEQEAKNEGLTSHFCEGPLLTVHVEQARGLLSHNQNYAKLRRIDVEVQRSTRSAPTVAAIAFNAPGYEHSAANETTGVNVTDGRVKRYIDSLEGILMDKPVTDAKLLYHSLHIVQIDNDAHAEFELCARWSREQIDMVRTNYKCDCTDSRQSGWCCGHIVAAMALLGKLSMDDLLSVLPVRRGSGGKRKARGALARARFSSSDTRFFSKSHLEELFVEKPAAPLHWSVSKSFEVKAGRGQTTSEHRLGTVQSWLENTGRYQWKIKFDHGAVELLDVAELAALVSYSHAIGTRVIP